VATVEGLNESRAHVVGTSVVGNLTQVHPDRRTLTKPQQAIDERLCRSVPGEQDPTAIVVLCEEGDAGSVG
jgi:hypothetical protein